MKKLFTFPVIVRFGLACVFLANSLTAFFSPSEFSDLISGSFVAGILSSIGLSVSAFITFVGCNDLTVSLLLLSGWKTSRVATYATAWITTVVIVIGVNTLDALEHLGFISMALSLALRGKRD
ncbi:MAG: hypothetical protein RLZZ26_659 [Candidatus Parcubacteria bacterium]|jgi:hypothetical protein